MTKKMLITGINGFIGNNCQTYFNKKYEIYGLGHNAVPSKNCIGGDVSLENLLKFNIRFDVILHLAGSGSVGEVQKNPAEEFACTIKSTEELVSFCAKVCPSCKLIYASSAAVYGNCANELIKETTTLSPVSDYGKHKLIVENLLYENYMRLKLDTTILRFFSVYGPNLRKQVFWDFSNRVLKNFSASKIQCFGTGREKRDFVYITDALRMIDIVAQKPSGFFIYNCGTGTASPIKFILDKIASHLGYAGELCFESTTRDGNPYNLVADMHKARELGFSCRVNIEEGLNKYMNWFKREQMNND